MDGIQPQIGIPGFSLHFPKELQGLSCWLSQFSTTKLRQPTGQTFFPTFPKEFSHFFQTQGSHTSVRLEIAKKNLIFHFGVDAMPLSLKNLMLNLILDKNGENICHILSNF